MKLVGKSIIGKKKAKEGFEYPIVRFPNKYSEIIGREAKIYEIDENEFLVLIGEDGLDNKLDNPHVLVRVDKNLLGEAKEVGIDISSFIEEKLIEVLDQQKTSRRRDLNPRPGDYKSPALPAEPRRLN